MSRIKAFGQKLCGRLRSHTGFSLGETMVALIIVALLTMAIATGVAFGAKQYRDSMILSESKVLCSTLSSVIRNELANATKVYTSSSPIGFESQNYTVTGSSGKRCFVMKTGESTYDGGASAYGEICVADQGAYAHPLELIPSAAYSTYGLSANVDVTYDSSGKYFTVVVKVKSDTKGVQAESKFTVVPLNKQQGG